MSRQPRVAVAVAFRPPAEMHIGLAQTLVVAPLPSVLYLDDEAGTVSFFVPATSTVVDALLPAPDPVTGATRTIVLTAPVGATRV